MYDRLVLELYGVRDQKTKYRCAGIGSVYATSKKLSIKRCLRGRCICTYLNVIMEWRTNLNLLDVFRILLFLLLTRYMLFRTGELIKASHRLLVLSVPGHVTS